MRVGERGHLFHHALLLLLVVQFGEGIVTQVLTLHVRARTRASYPLDASLMLRASRGWAYDVDEAFWRRAISFQRLH